MRRVDFGGIWPGVHQGGEETAADSFFEALGRLDGLGFAFGVGSSGIGAGLACAADDELEDQPCAAGALNIA